MGPVYHSGGHVLCYFWIPRNLMTLQTFFVKSILVQTFAFTSVYDMIMPLKQFEKKGPLNVESAFKGVFIQEDLSNQRSK